MHVSNHDNRGWKDFGKFLYSGTDMTMVDLCWGASLHHALLRLVIGSSEGEDSHCQEGIALTQKKKITKMVVRSSPAKLWFNYGYFVMLTMGDY